MSLKSGVLAVAVSLILFLYLSGCLEKVPEELSLSIPSVPVPTGLRAVVGGDRAELSWRVESGFAGQGFHLYRRDGDTGSWARIAQPKDTTYSDGPLRVGVTYWYKVAALSSTGIEGEASLPIPVEVGLFGVSINGGSAYTNSTEVSLDLSAPMGTQSVRFSEDSTFADAVWFAYAPSYSFTLSPGDGDKKVYASFIDKMGNMTDPVWDEIELDSRAAIASLSFSPSSAVPPGSTLRFSVQADGGESGGVVQVDIAGSLGFDVRDDGFDGDTQAGDGFYERDYTLPRDFRGQSMTVTAYFVDRAGNVSETVEFPSLLSISDPPAAVWLYPPLDSTVSSVTLLWGQSQDEHFSRYVLYRDDTVQVSREYSLAVATITDRSVVTCTDAGLDEGSVYYYRVYVFNDLEEAAGSNARRAQTQDLPPSPVVCQDPEILADSTSVRVSWSMSGDDDFQEYRLYRSTAPGVTEGNGVLVGGAPISDRYQTFADDTGLDLVGTIYYYRVYVYDRAWNKVGSNEVSTR